MLDEIFFHIETYMHHAKHPNIAGLRYWMIRYGELDPKDGDLLYNLRLYLYWAEQEEKYEQCAIVNKLIKEYESTGL